jgi:hypothetical protein
VQRRPVEQGDFDGACGFYAVHNALSWLYPRELDERDFRWLLAALSGSRLVVPIEFFLGTHRKHLGQLLDAVRSDRRFSDLELRRPFWSRHVPVNVFWDRARDWLEESGRHSAVIFAYDDAGYAHWTVANGASARQLRLRDSYGLRTMARARCYAGRGATRRNTYWIETTCTFLLRRG